MIITDKKYYLKKVSEKSLICNSNVYGLIVLKNKSFNEIKRNGVGGMQKWPVSSLSHLDVLNHILGAGVVKSCYVTLCTDHITMTYSSRLE